MYSAPRILLVFIFIIGLASPAFAVRSFSETNLEEINRHQAGAATALVFGDHTLLNQGDFAFSGHVHASGWGNDSLYGAWGLSFQAKPWERVGLGLSYGYTDAQLHTHTWLLNAQFSLVEGPDNWLQLQTGVGHQFLDSSESGNVLFFEFDNYWPIRPDNPQVLLDDVNWTHGFFNILAKTQLWIFRPQMTLGYVYTHYSWSGWEVPLFGGLDAGTGEPISDSGNSDSLTWSVGLGLDLDPVRPFVGLSTFENGGLFLMRVSIVF